MRLGPSARETLRKEVHGALRPGEELVVVGAIALGVTERLLLEQAEYLKKRFSPSFLREASVLVKAQEIGALDEEELKKTAQKAGMTCFVKIDERGFLAALWKMAEVSEVGLRVDLRRVPIYQETIEICECFDINPYEAESGSAFLFGFSSASPFLEECTRRGIPAAWIGRTNGENARLLQSGESVQYLNRPKCK